jgi:hypothetical protein
MKSSQWIGAFVVLILIVFVVTFAMNYINPSKPPSTAPAGGPGAESGKMLTIPVQTLPESPSLERTWIYHENGKGGWVDFPFENPYDEEVKVGLYSKNCICTNVQIVLAPPAWKERHAQLTAAKNKAEAPFFSLIGPAGYWEAQHRLPLPEEDQELHALEGAAEVIAKLEPDRGPEAANVPGKSRGWVRLAWNDNNSNREPLKRYSGDLWFGDPNARPPTTVQAEVHFVSPVRTETTAKVLPELNEADLEAKPFETSIRVWSATRPSVALKTQVVRPLRFDAKRFDPFEVGQPVPLSPAETVELQREVRDTGTVRCAYRIPITLHGYSPDKKVRVDLGPFRRRFQVVWTDGADGVQPMELVVAATVQGNVLVGDAQDSGRLGMGTFDSAAGSAPVSLRIAAQTAGVDLEVDKDRTPEFLRGGIRLESLHKGDELPRWKLTLRVPPNAAHGNFPRDNAEMYYDGAVYLKVKGDVIQNIRVPVSGIANDR